MTLFAYFSKFLEVKLQSLLRFGHNNRPIRQQNDEIHWRIGPLIVSEKQTSQTGKDSGNRSRIQKLERSELIQLPLLDG
jgi:hypothetical protein